MPNTNPPLTDEDSYEKINKLASENSLADYGLFYGATTTNFNISKELSKKIIGMKMYLNETFSTLKLTNISDWQKHFETFPKNLPIVCHAEKQTLAAILTIARLSNRHVHICHISTADEILLIKKAKLDGWNITCEICPHHLFLTNDDLPDGWKEVRPKLETSEDVKILWENLDFIDCFATDHAPHTKEEKLMGTPGFPGVEYMLPLFLTAVKENKLTMEQLVEKLYTNPKKIFNLPDQADTYIEIAMDEEWIIPDDGGHSKCKWTPYNGRKVVGKVRNVVIRGEEVYIDGNFIAKPGFGKNVKLFTEKIVKKNILERDDSFEKQRRASGDSISPTVQDLSPIRQLGRSHSPKDNPLFGKHVIKVEMFTKEIIHLIMEEADRCRVNVETKRRIHKTLAGYSMASMFYEVSTRTRCSFDFAMQRLGGVVGNMDSVSSSVQKGETLEDSIAMMESYADVIVLRHPEVGAAEKAAMVARKPVINAGDGTGQHPTQALLDLYTIRSELSTINKLTIAMVGDLKNGRTVHSLAKILCCYKDITLHYVSPTKDLAMPKEIVDYVNKNSIHSLAKILCCYKDITLHYVSPTKDLAMPKEIIDYVNKNSSGFVQKEFTNLIEGIQNVDVIYMTRVQKERFANPNDYEKVKGKFVITPQILDEAHEAKTDDYNVLGTKNKLPILMHPLPRVDEISREVDADERAAYFRQAQNGLYVRMALLKLVLGVD
uniref:Aspartate carbamoyltransferase n=1 Tax=Panagrolaimus sp. JU765 TaxID=591449 RepID=A0AC34Q3K0_9BILA